MLGSSIPERPETPELFRHSTIDENSDDANDDYPPTTLDTISSVWQRAADEIDADIESDERAALRNRNESADSEPVQEPPRDVSAANEEELEERPLPEIDQSVFQSLPRELQAMAMEQHRAEVEEVQNYNERIRQLRGEQQPMQASGSNGQDGSAENTGAGEEQGGA